MFNNINNIGCQRNGACGLFCGSTLGTVPKLFIYNLATGWKYKIFVRVNEGEEDIHAYDLSQLQKPIDDDIESVGTSVKKWPDMSLTRPGQW